MRRITGLIRIAMIAFILQGTTWAYGDEPTRSSKLVSQSKELAYAVVAKPVNGVIGLGVGTLGGALMGGYLTSMIATGAVLPDRCVPHGRFSIGVRGGPLCYAAWVPVVSVSAPIGMGAGAAIGGLYGIGYGFTHGYVLKKD